jgi:hypothetical protein
LPASFHVDAARRQPFIREVVETMPADLLARRLKRIMAGSDRLAVVLYYWVAGRRLATMLEAGAVTRDPNGRVVISEGAGDPDARIVAALKRLRTRLLYPADTRARKEATKVIAAKTATITCRCAVTVP